MCPCMLWPPIVDPSSGLPRRPRHRGAGPVKCGEGFLKVLELQLEGKKRMAVKDFLLGYKLSVGTKLGK